MAPESPRGLVFDVQRFSLGDGPGVRTTVFFKGCPLRCRWCHNPESWTGTPEFLFDPAKCLHCPECAPERCPSLARRRAGAWRGVDEVMREVLADAAFYPPDGGLTLSGGEPLLQPDFALALLKAARAAGLHTVVESSLHAAPEAVARLAPWVDLWLADVKAARRDHARLTGATRELVDANWKTVSPVVARVPAFGFNLTPELEDELAALVAAAPGARGVELLPGHDFGATKRRQLGLPDPEGLDLSPPADLDALAARLAARLPVPVTVNRL